MQEMKLSTGSKEVNATVGTVKGRLTLRGLFRMAAPKLAPGHLRTVDVTLHYWYLTRRTAALPKARHAYGMGAGKELRKSPLYYAMSLPYDHFAGLHLGQYI